MNIKVALVSIAGLMVLMTMPVLVKAQYGAAILTPSPASRQGSTAQQTRIQSAISRADSEITRRLGSLSAVINRIQAMKRVSDADKSNYVSQAQSQITNLNGLKTKIDADTDLPTLRSDIKSIFDQYRIYMLFIPKLRVLAAADRMNEIAGTMNTLATTKLQARIVAAGNPSAATVVYNDLLAKIADAKTQYQNAQNTVTGLTPDYGDAGKMATNKAALQSAWGMIKAGETDLKTARADIQTIVQTLKGLKNTIPTPAPTL